LAAESVAAELSAAQERPEALLGFGHVAAQLARERSGHKPTPFLTFPRKGGRDP